jgi:hypothetical protein
MREIVLIFAIVFLTSCLDSNKSEQSRTSANSNDQVFKTVDKPESLTIKEVDVFKRFIKILETDNYNVDTTQSIGTLKFTKYVDLEETERIEFKNNQFKSFHAKRKNPIKNMQDNWYPSFYVYEIYFQDSLKAKDFEKELNGFIRNDDIFNEKYYDYILRNNDRLIYVLCKAKIFEEYTFSYQGKLGELINN